MSTTEPAANVFANLSPQEITVSYYGYWYRLQDLQALQQSGKRIPGGMSGRIELASLRWQVANQALDDLVSSDPAKAKEVQEYLAVSSAPIILRKAQVLKTRLKEQG